MKIKIYSSLRYPLFIIILLVSLVLLAKANNNLILKTIAATTTLEPKHFLTVEKPMLGFKISYPSDWIITDNDFVISFSAPTNTAHVTFSITNLTSFPKTNLTLEQYSSIEIKLVENKKVGNFFKLIESKPYLLSGQPGHEILFLNGTSIDAAHDYKTLMLWTMVDDKVYQIRYSAQISEYSNYAPTVIYMIDSFRLL